MVSHGQALVGLQDQPPDLQRAQRRRRRSGGRDALGRGGRGRRGRCPDRRRRGWRWRRGGGRSRSGGGQRGAGGAGDAGAGARGGTGARRALGRSGAPAMAPVQRRPRRLRSVSSGGSGMMSTISRALSVPSTRESTNPSVGVRATGCARSRGSAARTSLRSRSSRASRTVAGSFSLRAASSRIWPVESRDAGPPSGRPAESPSSSSNPAVPPGRSRAAKRISRTCQPTASSRRASSTRPSRRDDGAERPTLGEHLLDRPFEVRLADEPVADEDVAEVLTRRRRSGRGRCAPRGSTARASPGRG